MKFLQEYDSYESYLAHQAIKSSTPSGIKIREGRFDKKVAKFKKRFEMFKLKPNSKVLCLGARQGEECVAFNELGHQAIGIDIVPFPPLVIKGDFNKLNFNIGTFDLIYINSFDHSYKPYDMLTGIHRTLKDDGLLWVDIFTNSIGEMEVINTNDKSAIIEFIEFNRFRLIEEAKATCRLYLSGKHKRRKEFCMLFKKG